MPTTIPLSGATGYKPTLTQDQFKAMLNDPALQGKNPSSVYKFLQSRGYEVQGFSLTQSKPPVTQSSDDQARQEALKNLRPEVTGNKTIDTLLGPVTTPISQTIGGIKELGRLGTNLETYSEKYVPAVSTILQSERKLIQPNEPKTLGEQVSPYLQPSNPTEQQGALATDIAATMIGGEALAPGKAAITGTPKVLSETGEVLSKAKGLGGGFLAKLASSLITSPISTEAAVETLQGRPATNGELALGTGLDLMFTTIGAVAEKLAPQIFRAGVNPEGKNYIDIEAKTDAGLGKYKGTKNMIVNQANTTIKNTSAQMDDLLSTDTTMYSRQDLAQGALDAASEVEPANPKLADSIVSFTDDWAKGGGKSNQTINATQLRNLKSKIGEMLSKTFAADKAGDLDTAAQKQALVGIWGKIDEALNAISPEVANLNYDMNVAYSIKFPLEQALEKPAFQSVLSMLKLSNIPGGTPVGTYGGAATQKISELLNTPGVPESVKSGILQALNSLTNPESNVSSEQQ